MEPLIATILVGQIKISGCAHFSSDVANENQNNRYWFQHTIVEKNKNCLHNKSQFSFSCYIVFGMSQLTTSQVTAYWIPITSLL